MYRDVQKFMKKYINELEWTKMCINVHIYTGLQTFKKMFNNELKCTWYIKNSWKCEEMYGNVRKHTKM